MEGIAGIVYPDVFHVEELIVPMLQIMRHRGAKIDQVTHKNFQLGICGGSIKTSEKEEIFIALDGRLTNQAKIRQELSLIGSPPPVNATDGELILHMYEWKGVDCIARLDGEFAFAIFDNPRERLVLARDRIGRKPLYWYKDSKMFLFGTELKSLLASGTISQTPSLEGLAAYLYFGYIPQDLSPVKGINKLLPGHYLQYNRNHSMGIHSYWSYSSFFETKREFHFEAELDDLSLLIKNAVERRLGKARPIGCFLTGGIGSGSVAHYLQNLREKPQILGFTSAFQGQSDEDLDAAQEMSSLLNIPCKTEWVTPQNLFDEMTRVAWFLDEPIADPNIKAMWVLAKNSAKEVKQVFSGMGSDELLAGHSRYSIEELGIGHSGLMGVKRSLYRLLLPLIRVLAPDMAFKVLKKVRTDPWEFTYLRSNALLTEKELEACSPQLAPHFDPEVFLQKFHHLSRIKSKVASYLYFDVKTRLPDCFALQVERVTAAHNLDWETPYLDREVVEYLAGMPEPDQLKETETARSLKFILRDVFPENVLMRPKRTRRDFLKPWMKDPQIYQVFKLLSKGMLIETNLISPSWLSYQLQNPTNLPQSFKILFGLLMLEVWLRLYINRPIPLTPPEISITELLSEFT